MNELPEGAILLIDRHYGVYIPKLFADEFPEHLCFEDYEVLKKGYSAEDHWDVWENYWQIWEDALDRKFTHPILGEGYLYQDGDLWFIPHENI